MRQALIQDFDLNDRAKLVLATVSGAGGFDGVVRVHVDFDQDRAARKNIESLRLQQIDFSIRGQFRGDRTAAVLEYEF